MFVKPTDLGPIYIEPFKADAYIITVNSIDNIIGTHLSVDVFLADE